MSARVFCGVGPFLFRRKASGIQGKGQSGNKKRPFSGSKIFSNLKASTIRSSSRKAGNCLTMMELKNKISTFRDLLNFSACVGSASLTELLILTLKDILKRYPTIRLGVSLSEFKDAPIHKPLKTFCDALKLLGDLWTTEMWMIKCKYDPSVKLGHRELEKIALRLLDDIIKLVREQLFEESDDEEEMREYSPRGSEFGKAPSESYSDSAKSPFSASPATPTSVLPEAWKVFSNHERCYSPPLLLSLRVQAVGKLSPIDLKRLYVHMFPHGVCVAQDPKYLVQLDEMEREGAPDLERNEKDEVIQADAGKVNEDDDMMDYVEMHNEVNGNPELKAESPKIGSSSDKKIDDEGRGRIDAQQVAAPVALAKEIDVPLLVPSSAYAQEVSQPLSLPNNDSVCRVPVPLSPNAALPLPPPPPPLAPAVPTPVLALPQPQQLSLNASPPVAPKYLAGPPPPPPPPHGTSANVSCAPPPPPPPMGLRNSVPQPLPSPMALRNGAPLPPPPPVGGAKGPFPPPPMAGGRAAPPPPPGSAVLRPRKAATKLKRSSQMGNLYRLLKGKIEGSSSDDKSSGGRKGKVGASLGGKQGMADALAEMTKRSAYFQQIEEDVKNYASVINELKIGIHSFQTSDMNELLNFHKHVESHLEKLTDETQVLSRYEDFPSKKLETLRMAAALYSKLDTIASTLQDWPISFPLDQLLDRSESYFNKIKVELDALERTKDEEAKKFQAQKISFDFGILARIKELMVDVSSNCMELALKEKREANTKQNGQIKHEVRNIESIKMLWRVFQFAFKVYTFAGGQDDRAERLTRELAHEIEICQ